ncbi:MAG: hypothetical protein KDC46_02325 [Thermoleophilia bacterium]|nr:hypothetical protein [Thermoleophilia bacterium]
MSGLIGPITPGRIAFAIGAVATGALVGGAVADHNDGDPTKGALIGGASALAGLALLVGGATLWRRVSAAHTATTGVAELATAAARARPAAVAAPHLSSSLTSRIQSTASRLLRQATEAAHLQPLAVGVPTYAATPRLPVAVAAGGSGSTFLGALGSFLR